MQLSLAISPCPNDTFIFDALIHHKIDTEGLDFKVSLLDIDALNDAAMNQSFDVVKVSYGVLPLIHQYYQLLQSGGALGRGVGPLLVTRKNHPILNANNWRDNIDTMKIGIPGLHTTAHFLLSSMLPNALNKEVYIFHEIGQQILNGSLDAGLLIHEGRFTYQDQGLLLLQDLGQWWEEHKGLPIPLGGIVLKRTFSSEIKEKLTRVIQKSIAYSWQQYPHLSDYVKNHAQEMSEDVMRQHIQLYVNEFSDRLGEEGEATVRLLFNEYLRNGWITDVSSIDCLD